MENELRESCVYIVLEQIVTAETFIRGVYSDAIKADEELTKLISTGIKDIEYFIKVYTINKACS